MNIKDFLDEVCEQIKYKPAKNEINNELKSHVEELKEEYINNGMDKLEAEEKAVSQMGVAKDIGKQLNKIHKPKLNWKLCLAISFLMTFGILISIFKQQITHSAYIGNTIIYMLCGFIISTIIYLFDYKKMKKYSSIIYSIATLIMILPFLKLGLTINDNSFARIFGITFSPYIIAIPLYIIAFVGYIDQYNGTKVNLLKTIIFSIISIVLITLLQSVENAILLGLIYSIITTIKIIENNQKIVKKLFELYSFALTFLFILILGINIENSINIKYIDKTSNYVQKDILENAQFIGETKSQAFKNDELLISQESNYTFLYLIGKVGIFLSIILISTLIVTFVLLVCNTRNITERYGRYLTIGLSSLFILESLVNILMNINTKIAVDVNLPFVTYGSVYFLINSCVISIILSIYRRKDINVYDKLPESDN